MPVNLPELFLFEAFTKFLSELERFDEQKKYYEDLLPGQKLEKTQRNTFYCYVGQSLLNGLGVKGVKNHFSGKPIAEDRFEFFCEKFVEVFDHLTPENKKRYEAINTAFIQWRDNIYITRGLRSPLKSEVTKDESFFEGNLENRDLKSLVQNHCLEHFENSSWHLYTDLSDINYKDRISILHFKNLIGNEHLETELHYEVKNETIRIWKGKAFVNLLGRVLIAELESPDDEYPLFLFRIRLPDILDNEVLMDGIAVVNKKSKVFIKQNLSSGYFIVKKSTVPLENIVEQLRENLYINGKNSIDILNRNPDSVLRDADKDIYRTFGNKVVCYKSKIENKIYYKSATLEEFGNHECVLRIFDYPLQTYIPNNERLVGYGIPNFVGKHLAFNLNGRSFLENEFEKDFTFLILFFTSIYNPYKIILGSLNTSSWHFFSFDESEYNYQARVILIDYDVMLKLNQKDEIILKYLDKLESSVDRIAGYSLIKELEEEIRQKTIDY